MPGRALAVVVLAAVLASCTGGDDGAGPPSPLERDPAGTAAGTDAAAPPTRAGGVALDPVDPTTVLVGDGLAFGAALPSEEAAAATFAEGPEVDVALTRRVYATADARELGSVLVLRLVGTAFYEPATLAAWEAALVGSLSGGPVAPADLGGGPGLVATGPDGAVAALREGDVEVVVTGIDPAAAVQVAGLMRTGRAGGAPGQAQPVTPLRPVDPAGAFAPAPPVGFVAFPVDEPAPVPPVMAGAGGADGRLVVVGGERRATAWILPTDPSFVPTAEVLQGLLGPVVSSRAGGAGGTAVELLDRVVVVADGGEPGSARGFRHGNLALVVEGDDPADLDAVVTAWITALGPP